MLWKGKEKEKKRETGGSGDQNGLLPILSLLSRQRKSVAIRFPRPCVATWFFVSRQGGVMARTSVRDRSAVRAAVRTTVMRARVRQGFSPSTKLTRVRRTEAYSDRKPLS